MKVVTLVATVVLGTSAWGQEGRPAVEFQRVAQRIAAHRHASLKAHSRTTAARAAGVSADAAAPLQAPAVVQTNLLDASNIVWLVTAEGLPAGAEIYPYLFMPDGTEIALDGWRLTQDVAAGSSFSLPNIRTFGPFWPEGFVTYWVGITMNGKDMQAAADFPVHTARSYDDLQYMVPRIASVAEGLSSGDAIVTIGGAFTRDPAYVLIEDKVAPAGAVQVSTTAITVNLSRIPGLDLGSFWDALLTVGQAGWCDTAILRHTPGKPGTYNPAPL